MRSLYIEAKLQAVLKESPCPVPAPGQVLINVDYVGICGSDLHYYYHGANGEFVVREPLVPGHELSGRVAEDPSGALPPGQPVTVHPARFGAEQQQFPDSPHLWPGGSYLGSASTWPHTQGATVDQLVVERDMVVPLPETLPVRRAVLAEPLAVAMHAVSKAGDLTGCRVLISGAGPIGLLTLVAARAAGAQQIEVSDVLAGPLRRAEELGADKVADVTQTKLPVNSYDVVFECSGAPVAITAALTAARPAGAVVQIGMAPNDVQPINIAPYIAKELRLYGTFRFKDEIEAAVELLAGQESIESVITHEFGLEEAGAAFDAAKDSQASGKVVFRL